MSILLRPRHLSRPLRTPTLCRPPTARLRSYQSVVHLRNRPDGLHLINSSSSSLSSSDSVSYLSVCGNTNTNANDFRQTISCFSSATQTTHHFCVPSDTPPTPPDKRLHKRLLPPSSSSSLSPRPHLPAHQSAPAISSFIIVNLSLSRENPHGFLKTLTSAASYHPSCRATVNSVLPVARFARYKASVRPSATSPILHKLASRYFSTKACKMSTPSTSKQPETTGLTAAEQKWSATKVRQTFIEFFEKKGHVFYKSSPCVPLDDKTLLFANAGMNQFKPIFLGTVDETSDFGKLKRACNTQKCIRAGGKHNDLEDVGSDSYHHTFFEMLGNWSFGDYFKTEAVAYSWELLTKVYGLDPARLYVTYFEGDRASGLEPDLETKELWRKAGVPDDHILPGNVKDNFWEMGDQGPCGPCTEIHYDRIGGRNAAKLVNNDDPNVLEIWNNVFIQFNRGEDKTLKPLPHKHVDTGMGFERLVSILQDKSSNYDTDVFKPLFLKIQEVAKIRSYEGKFGHEDVDSIDKTYRVVADHLRTLSFGIADGGRPDNDGRGYVLRRIVRRGARYARKFMKVNIGSFFSSLLPALVEQLGPTFPELKEHQALIKKLLDMEEESFARTLDRGEKKFEQLAELATTTKTPIAGHEVWKLYDTYGFPLDLTYIMAEESSVKIDTDGVLLAEKKAKEISKVKKVIDGITRLTLDVHALAALKEENIPAANDEAKFLWGDEAILRDSKILKIFVKEGFVKSTEGLEDDVQVGILLDKTCLYAEQGGQIYDFGTISIPGKSEIFVDHVVYHGKYALHSGTVKYGTLKVGDVVQVEYDEARRSLIRVNHTATHVLNYALKEVLAKNGGEVHQRGSLVDQLKTRFDISWDGPISPEQIEKVENESNSYINQKVAVYTKEIDIKTAQAITGVRAVFGEKYPDPVRVVSLGIDLNLIVENPTDPQWAKVSIEFCGGTHLKTVSDITEMVITEESGIGKGIRRVVCVTNEIAAGIRVLEREIAAKLKEVDEMPFGPKKEAAGKAFSTGLNSAQIGLVKKNSMKAEFAKVNKQIIDDAKARAKGYLDKAEAALASAFDKNTKKSALIVLDAGPNGKTLTDVLKTVGSSHGDKAVYFVVKPDEGDADGKIFHALHLPQTAVTQTTTAPIISRKVSELIGGGAGPSRDGRTSQGAGIKLDKYDEGIKLIEKLLGELNM
ncbi:Alanine--tRNA ligase [Orbilia oligospora]|uniref:Alanine--tRNA ligase n=1 Tax=Orbilia oligospora TaxID=2813651 RepID=A0A7C8NQ53_ORBOL|nr:Alanine--tRNA ligase [Orbilia oligospora]KAF3124010.1 Alanine--tRNA ligase [Orbilia oligospora]